MAGLLWNEWPESRGISCRDAVEWVAGMVRNTHRGHVFCSFLALVLIKELHDRLEAKGLKLEWADIIRDLDRLQEVEIEQDRKRFVLRTQTQGTCGKVFQAVGVALPPTLRQLETQTGIG